MRNNRLTVPLFSIQGHMLRHVTLAEAYRMIDLKQAHQVSARNKPLKIQLKQLDRESKNTPATITFSECNANAFAKTNFEGAHSRTASMPEVKKQERLLMGRASEDFIERAEAKVALWPFIGDDKAVRVGPVPV
jgi:hypothetical protein